MKDLNEVPFNEQIYFIAKHIKSMPRKDRIEYVCKLNDGIADSITSLLSANESLNELIISEIPVELLRYAIHKLYNTQKEAVNSQKDILNLINTIVKSLEYES